MQTDRYSATADKQEIRDALLRFTRGIDRLDRALILSAFHDDAVDDHGPFKGTAADFVDWALPILSGFHVSQHRVSNIQIELLGERANVETYLLALHVTGDPSVEEVVWGRYLDKFEKRDGAWKIAQRLVVIDHSTTRECPRPYEDEAAYSRAGRDRADPVYAFRWA